MDSLAEIKKAIEAAKGKVKTAKKKQEIEQVEAEVKALESLEGDVKEQAQEIVSQPEPAPQEQPVSIEDRSQYNCPDCHGEGLLPNGKVDPRCNGTGKI